MLVWTCGICMKYVWLLSSPSSHTVVVGFHLHVGVEYLCIQLCELFMRVVMMCFVASGATASEMKLVPHEPRVGLDTLYVLGRVVFAYVFEVNIVGVFVCFVIDYN